MADDVRTKPNADFVEKSQLLGACGDQADAGNPGYDRHGVCAPRQLMKME